ncbi:hypothetical protein WDU94_002894 [Cyamophila willieti]
MGLFLTFMLVSSVCIWKIHECKENFQRAHDSVEEEKGKMTRPAPMNEDICEDGLHRMRREVSIENLFNKTPWNTLEQDDNNRIHEFNALNVKQFLEEDMTHWRKLENGFAKVKKRTKRGCVAWSEDRKKKHAMLMRAFWKYHREENTSWFRKLKIKRKEYWANDKSEGVDRRISLSKRIKRYWRGLKEAGFTHHLNHYRELSVKMKKLNEDPERRKEISERLLRYWEKRKIDFVDGTSREVKISNGLRAYWKRMRAAGKNPWIKTEARLKKLSAS